MKLIETLQGLCMTYDEEYIPELLIHANVALGNLRQNGFVPGVDNITAETQESDINMKAGGKLNQIDVASVNSFAIGYIGSYVKKSFKAEELNPSLAEALKQVCMECLERIQIYVDLDEVPTKEPVENE